MRILAQIKDFKLFDFLKRNLSNVLFALLVVIGIGFFVKKNLVHPRSTHSRDFILIRETFDKCRKNEVPPQEVLTQVQTILKKNPQLHAQYDGRLALLYEAQAQTAEAIAVATSLLDRTKPFLPAIYHRFGEIALMIAIGNHEEALIESQKLHKELELDPKATRLMLFNLLRLHSLAQVTGNQELTKTTRQSLQAHPAFPEISHLFQEGEVTFFELP